MATEAETAETRNGDRRSRSTVAARAPIQLPARFEYLRTLGVGGMGTVVAARDVALGRTVAIKVVGDDGRSTARERFAVEIRAVAALNHPNIVTIHDVDERGRVIVMELAAGGSLADRFAAGERFAGPEARELAFQLLDAVGAAHKAGIVHRDIKPANVLLSASGQVKLADFGIACVGESELTQTGAQVGTRLYMAPEQLRGGDGGVAADIYATGATLFEAITGKRLNRHDGAHPDPRGAVIEAIGDRDLAETIVRATEERPGDRFASAPDFAAALASGSSRRRRWKIALALALAFVTVIGVALAVRALRTSQPAKASAAANQSQPQRAVVAMLPFDNGDSLYPGGELGLAQLLGLQLAQTGHVDVIGVRRVANHAGSGAPLEAWRSAAIKLDAEFTIRGQIHISGDEVSISIVVERSTGELVMRIPRAASAGQATEQLRWAAPEVLRAIGGQITPSPASPRTDVPDLVWADLARGIQLLWAHEHTDAYHYLRTAVDNAPDLAIARYYLAITMWWNSRPSVAVVGEIDTAIAGDLAPVHRATLEALKLLIAERFADSIAAFRALVDEHPEEMSALYGLFEALFHGGYPEQAIATYERLYEIYPGANLGFQHALDYYAAHDRPAKLRTGVHRLGAYDEPSMRLWVTRALFADRKYDEVAAAVRQTKSLPPAGSEERSAKSLSAALLIPALAVSGRLDQAVTEARSGSESGFSSAIAKLGLAIALGDDDGQARATRAVREYLNASDERNAAPNWAAFALTVYAVASDAELHEFASAIGAEIPADRRRSRDYAVPLALIAGKLADVSVLERFSTHELPEVAALASAYLARLDGDADRAARQAELAVQSAADGRFLIAERLLIAELAKTRGDRLQLETMCAEIVRPRVFAWTWAGAQRRCAQWLGE